MEPPSEELSSTLPNQPVLASAVVEGWLSDPDGIYVDGTFGRGGHSRLLLERLSPQGRLLVIDRDPEAIAVARQLAAEQSRVEVVQGEFAAMAEPLAERGWTGQVDGILLDLGVSSPQLDAARRGFSFMRDGPLDMRMDPGSGRSAAQWLAVASVDEVADVLRRYGEERFAGRIARAIVAAAAEGGLETTAQLAAVIEQAMPRREKGKHPATRSFQAIRIYINRELEQLENFLSGSIDLLCRGGRLAIISFHSLEDRLVKRFMRDQSRGDYLPPSLPVTDDALNRRLAWIVKARRANAAELEENVRARSAILRVAERL